MRTETHVVSEETMQMIKRMRWAPIVEQATTSTGWDHHTEGIAAG